MLSFFCLSVFWLSASLHFLFSCHLSVWFQHYLHPSRLDGQSLLCWSWSWCFCSTTKVKGHLSVCLCVLICSWQWNCSHDAFRTCIQKNKRSKLSKWFKVKIKESMLLTLFSLTRRFIKKVADSFWPAWFLPAFLKFAKHFPWKHLKPSCCTIHRSAPLSA